MTSQRDALRVGGELELSMAAFTGAPNGTPLDLPSRHAYWTDTGRSALLLAGSDILSRGGVPIAWVPAFCCRSVTQALQQAGYSIRYYSSTELHGGPSAELDPGEGETVLFVHYFGHLNELRLAQALRWRARGVHVIEDAVQATFTKGIGTIGHYTITSLRKFMPQPDGALLGSEREMRFSLEQPDETFISARSLAKLMRGAGEPAEIFLALIAETESRLDTEQIVPRKLSWLSHRLMARNDTVTMSERRRTNQRRLYRYLSESFRSKLDPLQRVADDGAVPLGLAARVAGGLREPLRQFLTEHGIYCPVHWSLPHVPKTRELSHDHELACEIITIPIDQRVQEHHVTDTISLLETFFASHP